MNKPVHTRTFKSGNSEAVSLPMGLGFGIGTDVLVEREGERVVLTPVPHKHSTMGASKGKQVHDVGEQLFVAQNC